MYVDLADDELILLDGRVGDEVQAKIDVIKHARGIRGGTELSEAQAKFVAEVVALAKKDKKLICRYSRGKYCPVCGEDAGYAKYTRATRYHRKGDKNLDRPLALDGMELEASCVRFKDRFSTGCCQKCFSELLPIIAEKLDGLKAEIPEGITGHPPKFKRERNCVCNACKWEGHDGQLGRLPAMMGGYYRGKCPKCGAENLPIVGGPIKVRDGYTIVETNTEVQEIDMDEQSEVRAGRWRKSTTGESTPGNASRWWSRTA